MATHITTTQTQVFRWPGGAKIGSLSAGTEVTVERTVDNGSSSVITNNFFSKEDPDQEIVVSTQDLKSLTTPPTPAAWPHQRIWVEDDSGIAYPYKPDYDTGPVNVSNFTI